MLFVTLRFYEELNDFLPPERRKKPFVRHLSEPTSVKDVIEGCGVPHTEVDLVLVNGQSSGFSRIIQHGDRLSVYPVFESFDISNAVRLQERPLRHPRFVADVHLGKLTRYLRLLGIDTAYKNDADDSELVDVMKRENRAILTRDRRLLMRKAVDKGFFVRSHHAGEQLDEVIHRFDLSGLIQPFSRCVACNQSLERVEKKRVMDRLEPLTKKYFNEFSRCPGCGRIYWPGSHLQRLDRAVRRWFKPTPAG